MLVTKLTKHHLQLYPVTHRHVLSGSLLEVEWSAGVSVADANVLTLPGVRVGVNADHAVIDVTEELLAKVVGHDGPANLK